MEDFTKEELNKGMKVTKYFFDKYGKEKCTFIMSRIATSAKNYDITSMIELGEKIAFFNSWTKDGDFIDKLHDLNNED